MIFTHTRLDPSWEDALHQEFLEPYYETLRATISQAYDTKVIYPLQTEIFAAFNLCPLPNVRVVILGQDPYHGAGEAHGLAFSVRDNVAVPPSLRNVLKEISTDTGTSATATSDLTNWATQGVLLLNSTLTVEKDNAGSHQALGWEQFTDSVIKIISDSQSNVVFLLWGAFAEKKQRLIDETKHLVLVAAHPSPLSAYRGFFGCRHFTTTNEYLKGHGFKEIIW